MLVDIWSYQSHSLLGVRIRYAPDKNKPMEYTETFAGLLECNDHSGDAVLKVLRNADLVTENTQTILGDNASSMKKCTKLLWAEAKENEDYASITVAEFGI